jgi:hypothetical protein
MRKILLLTILVICVASLSQVYGQVTTTAPSRGEVSIVQEEHHRFEMASEMFYMHYKEPGVMKNEGLMVGGDLNYHYRNKLMLGLENRIAFGEADYHSHDTGMAINNDAFLLETRAVMGADLRGEEFAVIPFSGFGYRYFYEDRSGSQRATGVGGYERNSNYLYSPVGVGFEYYINELWTADLLGEFDVFWAGFQRSVTGDALAGAPTLYNEQGFMEGYGFKGTAGVSRQVQKMTVRLAGFYHYWDIGESKNDTETIGGTTARMDVPRNKTQEIGGQISFLF